MDTRFTLAALSVALTLGTAQAHAWGIGSQLDNQGCHERITAEALRRARGMQSTAPVLAPTRDEQAIIDTVQFEPPADFKRDLAGMSLLLGVRDNDVKGENPLDSLQLVEVHGDPATQEEHCIRALVDDDAAGNISALAACRGFIHERAMEALEGLGADGVVDPAARMELAIYLSFAKHHDANLPLFYVKMGQALHALQDGFTHTYRTEDGIHPTVVLNYIEYVTPGTPDEGRDGPDHLSSLDHCDNQDATVQRNFGLSIAASTELLAVALDPAKTKIEKGIAFDLVLVKYLTYEERGCTVENKWCDAIEAKVIDTSGCDAGGGGAGPWSLALLVGATLVVVLRRRSFVPGAALGLVLAGSMWTSARADDAPAVPPQPADTTPAVDANPTTTTDAADAAEGKEPGRDVSTPTVTEVKDIREDKRLGSPFGFAANLGGSLIHGAAAVNISGLYRINERWLVGIGAEWNPWITSSPFNARAGAINAYGTVVRRFPMKFDRVNLRTTLHLGASRLMFDVPGAPKGSIGPFASFTPLGIDYDLGNSVRFVLDPVEIAVPMPYVGLIPLYYEQFRLMVGIQIGA
jgi:hypothetical protein